MASVDDHAKHLRSKSANMSDIKPNANSSMPDRLYGEHYPDSFLDVSKPIWNTSVATLGDYIRHLQEVDNKPNKPCFACESNQPNESDFQHICPNNPILTCNCVDPKYCSELGSDPDRQFNEHGWKRCPDSGKICSTTDCPDGCKGDHDGFSDNLDYIEGQPIPTKRQGAVRGWPSVVVGAVPETWNDANKCIPRPEHSERDTE